MTDVARACRERAAAAMGNLHCGSERAQYRAAHAEADAWLDAAREIERLRAALSEHAQTGEPKA